MEDIYTLQTNQILYPKLDPLFSQFPIQTERSDYFVFIGRLVTFSKQVDIIIHAFNENGHKLIIIGSGPDEHYLQSIAWPNIEFLGRIADPEKRCEIIWKACWLVNITMESFGYVTAESLCLGTPVLGYIKWATKEIIADCRDALLVRKQNWILIEKQTVDCLLKWITEFKNQTRDYHNIAKQAREKFTFSNLKFELK